MVRSIISRKSYVEEPGKSMKALDMKALELKALEIAWLKRIVVDRGRDTGCPVPPAQTRTGAH
jgi:hypothetical protein